jgi:hypothetical protein
VPHHSLASGAPQHGLRLPFSAPNWVPPTCMVDVGADGGARDVAAVQGRGTRHDCQRPQLYQGALLAGVWTPGYCLVGRARAPAADTEQGCAALSDPLRGASASGER